MIGSGCYLMGKKLFGNLFKDAGYTTCIAGKWQLNGISYKKELRTGQIIPALPGLALIITAFGS